jgi:glycosyltransferase involved in cell wall biosynthesis
MQTLQLGKEWFAERSGGLNRYYADLVRELPRLGVGVTGLVTGTEAVRAATDGTVHVFASSGAHLVSRLHRVRSEARRLLARQPGTLLVSHFALYTAPCLDLVRRAPLVVHFHGPWAAESAAEGGGALATRLKRVMEAAVYRRATRFIVLSQAFADVLVRTYGVDAGRVRIVPGGVDARRFAPSMSRHAARAALGWPVDRPIALVVRRLVRRMGLEALVAGIAQARQRSPDLLVLVAGRGPLAGELAARCEAEGAGGHVRLLGFVPDEQLPLAYRAADLSIVPSASLEGFGLIVAESLAAGTPVLVTAVGGLPETLDGLAPQCVIREPGAQALGDAVGAALAGQLALPDAQACIRHARERFDWAVVGAAVRGVYAEAAP